MCLGIGEKISGSAQGGPGCWSLTPEDAWGYASGRGIPDGDGLVESGPSRCADSADALAIRTRVQGARNMSRCQTCPGKISRQLPPEPLTEEWTDLCVPCPDGPDLELMPIDVNPRSARRQRQLPAVTRLIDCRGSAAGTSDDNAQQRPQMTDLSTIGVPWAGPRTRSSVIPQVFISRM